MRKIVFLLALGAFGLTLSACDQVHASEPSTIKLSASEAKQARDLAEQRQQIAFDISSENLRHQTETNHLNDRMAALNIDAEKLCFELKKAHAMNPGAQYYLDEWRGELKKP